jgi:hypothetical protein
MSTVVPDIYNVFTAPHIQASIFNWIYLRCHWRYADIWVRVILQSWCQIQRTFSTLRYLNCGPGHIHCKYSSAYSGFYIQLNVSALILEISRQFIERYTAISVPNTAHPGLRYVYCGPGHIQGNYCYVYSGFNIQVNVSAVLFVICEQYNARYTANLVP